MKVQAQDLKVGMIIKYGNNKGVIVSAPEQSIYRSSDVDMKMEVFPTTIKRRNGNLPTEVEKYIGTATFRKTTMVQVH